MRRRIPALFDHPCVTVGQGPQTNYKKFRKPDKKRITITEDQLRNWEPTALAVSEAAATPSLPAQSSTATASAPIKKSKSHAEKAKLQRENMDKLSTVIRDDFRESKSVKGRCCFGSGKCQKASEYRAAACEKAVRYCKKHAKFKAVNRDDIVDILGRPILGWKKRKGQVLYVYATHWIFGDKRTNNSGFAPGSPNRPSVFFHVNLLQNLYIDARDGLSMKKIWRMACNKLPSRLPINCYKQFITAFVSFNTWNTLERNLLFQEKSYSNCEVEFGARCPCCFGDKKTSKTIILVR